MSLKKTLVTSVIVICLAGDGTAWYLHNQSVDTSNPRHSLNLKNVNKKSVNDKADRIQNSQTAQGKAEQQEKQTAKEAARESSFQKYVHNDGMTDKQLETKYRVTGATTDQGKTLVKQATNYILQQQNAKNFDTSDYANKYFNDEVWKVADYASYLQYGWRPDYSSFKLTYYDGYVYKFSMSLTNHGSGSALANVTGYYVSKTNQLQLKTANTTLAGNEEIQKVTDQAFGQ